MANALPANKKGYTATDYDASVVAPFDMIEKIALQVIREVKTIDPLEVFEKGQIGNGTTIEQVIVELVDGTDWDKDGAHTLDKKTIEMISRYFKDITDTQFATTVQKSEIKKVMKGDSSYEEVAGRLVATLTESERHDKFNKLKALLVGACAEDTTNSAGAPIIKLQNDALTSPEEVMKLIKNTVKGFKFVSNKFNGAGIDRSTYADDIYIVAPYTVISALDVDFLAGVFNLSKVEMEARLIETDATDGKVYILDRNAVVCYTKDYEMTEQWNGEGRFMNYYLTVERIYGVSPLFNAVHFDTNL